VLRLLIYDVWFPLDEETILKSVAKTNKVLIVHEDKVFGGFGGELSALITEKAFSLLDAPIKRVGSPFYTGWI
jgi:2-oxoisovalerate dehydrogenase E1 component